MKKIVSMILALCLVLGTFSLPATAAERDMSRFAAEQTDAGNGEDLSGTEEAGDSDPAETGEEDEAVPEETEDEAEDAAAEDEGLFRSGYAYVAAGTAGYKAANSGEKAGSFTARSAVYASLSSRESEADRDWFRVAFYTRDGIAAGGSYETVYVRRASLTAMNEREIAALGALLRQTEALEKCGGNTVPTAEFKCDEAEDEDETGDEAAAEQEETVTVTANRQTASAGQTVTLTASFSMAVTNLTYKWQTSPDGVNNWTDTSMTGFNTSVLSFTATQENLSCWYRCVVMVRNITYASAGVKVTWQPSTQSKVTISVNRTSAGSGDSVKFTATATGTSGSLTYQWYRSADKKTWEKTTLGGNATKTLQFSATKARLSYWYRCSVTDSNGTYNSGAKKVTWVDVVVTAIANRESARSGDYVEFSATATGTTGSLTWLWQKSSDGVTWSSAGFSGYKTATMSFDAIKSRLNYDYRCAVTDDNGTWYSNTVHVDYKSDPVVTAWANRDSARAGDHVEFSASVTNTEGSVSWLWQKSSDGIAWSSAGFSGYKTATMSFDAIKSRLSYDYRCAVTDSRGTWYSNIVHVDYKSDPVVTAWANRDSARTGDYVEFNVSATDTTGTVKYLWQKSSDGIAWSSAGFSGYKTATMYFDAIKSRLNYDYRCAVTDSRGTWYSNVVHVEYVPNPVVNAWANRDTARTGDYVEFNASVSNGAGTLKYLWQKSTDGANWSSAGFTGYKTATMHFDALKSRLNYDYRCAVTDDYGTWYSNTVHVEYVPDPVVTAWANRDTARTGDYVEFSASVTNTEGSVSWLWQKSTDGANWSSAGFTGYKTATMYFDAIKSRLSYDYRCAVTDSRGTWYSNTVHVEYVPNPVVTAWANRDTAHTGDYVEFNASVANGAGTLKYLWQKSTDGVTWSSAGFSGYKTATMSFDAIKSRLNYDYRCAVTDDRGTWYSNTVHVEYVPDPMVTAWVNRDTAHTGDYVEFNVYVINESGGLKYLWQKSTDGVTWSSAGYNGYKTASMGFDALKSRLKYEYRCAVTDDRGTWYSNTVKVTWKEDPVIDLTCSAYEVISGTTVTLYVTSYGTEGALSYRWYYSTDGSSFSYWKDTSSSQVSYTASQTYYFCCEVTDSTGTWTSSSVKVTVKADPTVTLTSNAYEVITGTNVTLTASAGGTEGSVTYSWYYSTGGETFSYWKDTASAGVTYTATQDYYFYCEVKDSNGTWRSNTVHVTVKEPPTVTLTSNVYEAITGTNVTLTVSASNTTGSVTYSWYHSADGSSYSYWKDTASASVTYTARQSYYFYCEVKDSNGTWRSNTIRVEATEIRYRALVIGNNAYKGDSVYCTDGGVTIVDDEGYVSYFNPLDGCVNDMNAMAGMLKGLTNSFTVTTRSNANAATILSSVSAAFAGATENDVSLFYYSGHGFGDHKVPTSQTMKDLQGGLCGVDSEIVKLSELKAELSKVKGKIIIILDCCHSGATISDNGAMRAPANAGTAADAFNAAVINAFAGDTITRTVTNGDGNSSEFKESKYMVITACTYTESSYEYSLDGYDCGVFTGALLRGMGCSYPSGGYGGSMPADTDGDSLITLYECYIYAKNTAQSWDNHQHAMYYGTGSTVIFRRK